MSKTYYLAKSGKSFGPYSEPDFLRLKESGELQQYSWYRLETMREWLPVDPPPAIAETSSPQRGYVSEIQPENAADSSPRPREIQLTSRIEAVCHDHRSVVTGLLRSVTEGGCEIVCEIPSSSPVFGSKTMAQVNLLDSESGRAMNVSVRVGAAYREKQKWIYPVRWNALPQLIEDTAKSPAARGETRSRSARI